MIEIVQQTTKTEDKLENKLPKNIRQIGNPYCYRHGKYTVKVSFSDTDATLEDRMLSYLRSKG